MSNLSNLSAACRSAMCAAGVGRLDAGAGAGKVKLYTTGKATLLATITFNDPAFVSPVVAGVATVSVSPSKPSGTGVADGPAAVAEFTDSAGNVEFDGTVTTTKGDGAITLASIDIVTDAAVEITGGTFTMPAS
jgi:hypothetical protein